MSHLIQTAPRKNKSNLYNFKLHLILILASVFTKCVSMSAFASFVGIPIGISAISAAEIKIFAVTAGIKRDKSIIKKKKQNMTGVNLENLGSVQYWPKRKPKVSSPSIQSLF